MLVKVIKATADTKKFEKELNDFISNHTIIDIKFSATTNYVGEALSFYSALILYKNYEE